MAEPHTHLFGPLGSLFVLAALVVSGALGFLGKPAVPSIAIGTAIFTIGYVLVRLPQILGLFHADGPKAFLMFLYIPIPYIALSAILYGIGRLFS